MDPVPIVAPRLLTSARVAAVLPERTKPLNINRKTSSGPKADQGLDTEERRGRSASPIRANVKRRRSVASAPGDVLGTRPPSCASSRDSCPLGGLTSGQRIPSSGRSIRQATPFPDDAELLKLQKVTGRSNTPKTPTVGENGNIKRSLRVTKTPSLATPELSLPGNAEQDDVNKGIAYETKGVFRLKKHVPTHEFRSPRPLGQSEVLWRPGDGFSEDEARPDFMFLMTGTHKRKRSQSLPRIGKLEFEQKDREELGTCASGNSRPKTQRLTQYEMRLRRGVAKDIWPTINNFSEELDARARNPTVPSKEIVPSTVSPKPQQVPQPRGMFGYVPPPLRRRNDSDFENFGRCFQRHREPKASTGEEMPQPTECRTRQSSRIENGDDEEREDEKSDEEEYEMEDESELVAAVRPSCYDDVPQDRELCSGDSVVSVLGEEKRSQELGLCFAGDWSFSPNGGHHPLGFPVQTRQ
ncbi:hypothetical protein AAE478_001911 [Parahypoxylon ruwenzoriense]